MKEMSDISSFTKQHGHFQHDGIGALYVGFQNRLLVLLLDVLHVVAKAVSGLRENITWRSYFHVDLILYKPFGLGKDSRVQISMIL